MIIYTGVNWRTCPRNMRDMTRCFVGMHRAVWWRIEGIDFITRCSCGAMRFAILTEYYPGWGRYESWELLKPRKGVKQESTTDIYKEKDHLSS